MFKRFSQLTVRSRKQTVERLGPDKQPEVQRIVVDVPALSHGIVSSVLIGSVVKVYGVPVEQRFKATGFIESVGRPR